MTFNSFFSGGSITRFAELRGETSALEKLWQDPATRFLATWDSRFPLRDDTVLLLQRADIQQLDSIETRIYLGEFNAAHIFGIELSHDPQVHGISPDWFENFRGLMNNLSNDEAALLAYAKGMTEWRKRHRHCGICGAANRSESGGFVMQCSSTSCSGRSFPRIDPAIIVLVTHADKCLLGRQQTWPEGRYSTIAGFVEPGESLEDAVRREVQEETDIKIGAVEYLSSQPWPFPTALMIGFHAQASSTAISLNDNELADAQWYSRDDIAAGTIALPPTSSIAFRLIERWFDQWEGPQLEGLNLSSSFSRSTGERS